MENTLMPGQYVLVDKLTPNFDRYHRGRRRRLHAPARLGARRLRHAVRQACDRRRRRHG